MKDNSEHLFMMNPRSSSIFLIIANHKTGVVVMNLHSLICTHCCRNGHTIDICYRKHDFPPHFGKNHVMANHYSLNFVKKEMVLMIQRDSKKMILMDLLRSNMIRL